jgi:hypothetical protein
LEIKFTSWRNFPKENNTEVRSYEVLFYFILFWNLGTRKFPKCPVGGVGQQWVKQNQTIGVGMSTQRP